MIDERRYIEARDFCEHGKTGAHPVTLIVERPWCPGPSPAVLPQPETPTWRCKRCGSDRWVAASLTGPDGPAIKQCIPCGRYSGDRVHPPLPETPETKDQR